MYTTPYSDSVVNRLTEKDVESSFELRRARPEDFLDILSIFVKNIRAGGTYLLLLSPFPKGSAGLRRAHWPVLVVRSSDQGCVTMSSSLAVGRGGRFGRTRQRAGRTHRLGARSYSDK